MNVGVIGLDSSHAIQFSRRINALNENAKTRCHVTHCWDAGPEPVAVRPDVKASQPTLQSLGIRLVGSLRDLLDQVHAVMVLNVDGRRHHELAMAAIDRGLPVFVDKPLTCLSSDAIALLECSQSRNARIYSASALRFSTPVPAVRLDAIGELLTLDAFGPVEERPEMPGLWYYGCHSFELVDSLWVGRARTSRVRAEATYDRYMIEMEYADGKSATIRLDRSGTGPFGASIRGDLGAVDITADLSVSYDALVLSIVRFFEGEPPTIPLRAIVENICTIEACHASLAQSGTWVAINRNT